jgi:hypothetical protein
MVGRIQFNNRTAFVHLGSAKTHGAAEWNDIVARFHGVTYSIEYPHVFTLWSNK